MLLTRQQDRKIKSLRAFTREETQPILYMFIYTHIKAYTVPPQVSCVLQPGINCGSSGSSKTHIFSTMSCENLYWKLREILPI